MKNYELFNKSLELFNIKHRLWFTEKNHTISLWFDYTYNGIQGPSELTTWFDDNLLFMDSINLISVPKYFNMIRNFFIGNSHIKPHIKVSNEIDDWMDFIKNIDSKEELIIKLQMSGYEI